MKKRQISQRRDDVWPFLFSVNERGLVKNVPAFSVVPPEPEPAKPKKKGRGWAGRHAAWAKSKKKIP